MLTMILELLQILCIGICAAAILYFIVIYVWPLIKHTTVGSLPMQAQQPVDPVQALLEVTEKTQSFRLEFQRAHAALFTKLNQEYCTDPVMYDLEIERISILYVQEYGEKSALIAIEAYKIPAYQEAQFVATFMHNLSITFPALLRDGAYVASTIYQEQLAKQLPLEDKEKNDSLSL